MSTDCNVISVAEVELFVQSLRKSRIEDIGSVKWFDDHRDLEKLRQQCYIEATNCVEEKVKDVIITYEKLPILVHEVICIQIWREKVLRQIIAVKDRQMRYGFIGYMILYHECTALNLLQILLYHKDVIQSMGDEALDLIDYCADKVVRLCNSTKKGTNKMAKPAEECDDRERFIADSQEMGVNTGLAAIAILSSFSQALDDLPVACVRRLYTTHDVPLLLASVLEFQPWKKQNSAGDQTQVFNDGQWTPWDPEELCKIEAQCWIALHGLLLHEAGRQHYEATEFRKQNLVKLQKYLHERVLDQIAPLLQLKQFLSQLSVWDPPRGNKTPLILETIPEIRGGLLARGSKWRKLAVQHVELIFESQGDQSVAVEIAKRVAETYDEDALAKLTPDQGPKESCSKCGKVAFKRCSRCRQVWYCSRQCQVESWAAHKGDCISNN